MVKKNKDTVLEDLGNGVSRKILAYEEGIMAVEFSFTKGSVGAVHSHHHYQIGYILSGEFEFILDGETSVLTKGDSYAVKPNLKHGVKALENGTILDTFAPMREDFLV